MVFSPFNSVQFVRPTKTVAPRYSAGSGNERSAGYRIATLRRYTDPENIGTYSTHRDDRRTRWRDRAAAWAMARG